MPLVAAVTQGICKACEKMFYWTDKRADRLLELIGRCREPKAICKIRKCFDLHLQRGHQRGNTASVSIMEVCANIDTEDLMDPFPVSPEAGKVVLMAPQPPEREEGKVASAWIRSEKFGLTKSDK
jgi:hypothetical protein